MERTSIEPRAMGPEIYWSGTGYFECVNCENEFTVEALVTCYAAGWMEDFDVSGGHFIRIFGFDDIIGNYFRNNKKVKLYGDRITILENYIDDLLKYIEESGGYVLLIVGDDDLEVWKQILKKENLDYRRVGIVKYGTGGIDEAIKACSMLNKPILKNIPKKLIVDSDGDRDKIEGKLRSKDIRSDDYHIWEKKDIDGYLVNSEAISKITGLDVSTLDHLIEEQRICSKGGLERLFIQNVGIKATPEIKGLIALNLPEVPKEFEDICKEIRSSLSEREALLDQRYEEG